MDLTIPPKIPTDPLPLIFASLAFLAATPLSGLEFLCRKEQKKTQKPAGRPTSAQDITPNT
jgi:hypothetical protein